MLLCIIPLVFSNNSHLQGTKKLLLPEQTYKLLAASLWEMQTIQ